jgi:hypothetical protein
MLPRNQDGEATNKRCSRLLFLNLRIGQDGVSISGFCVSSSTLREPGSVPPTLSRMGSGVEVFDVILKRCS